VMPTLWNTKSMSYGDAEGVRHFGGFGGFGGFVSWARRCEGLQSQLARRSPVNSDSRADEAASPASQDCSPRAKLRDIAAPPHWHAACR
jgi:hypothetical protein